MAIRPIHANQTATDEWLIYEGYVTNVNILMRVNGGKVTRSRLIETNADDVREGDHRNGKEALALSFI